MTSKVIVETYSYPVLVEELKHSNNNPEGQWAAKQVVQPGEKADFTLCSGQQFKITEQPAFPQPKPKSPAPTS